MTPARILHLLAGSPALDGAAPLDAPAPCWVCARPSARVLPVRTWLGAQYTDQNRARCASSPWVCEPCAWSCSWVAPPGFRPAAEGKRGVNLRLYSHLYCERDGASLYLAANKADKPWIRAWLALPKPAPWFCAIADSGQKHVLPWTPINLAPGVRGTVRFEERDVPVDERHTVLVVEMSALLTAGATKEEIERGDYRPDTWRRLGEATVRAVEREWLAPARGGGGFALALWLAQRDEDVVAARLAAEKEAKRGRRATVGGEDAPARRGVRARGAAGVPRGGQLGPDALDADRATAPSVGPDVRDGARVDERRGQAPPPRRGEQLSLLGDG